MLQIMFFLAQIFTECYSGAGCFVINPKTDPTQHHDQDTRQIGLKNEVSDVSLKFEAQG